MFANEVRLNKYKKLTTKWTHKMERWGDCKTDEYL